MKKIIVIFCIVAVAFAGTSIYAGIVARDTVVGEWEFLQKPEDLHGFFDSWYPNLGIDTDKKVITLNEDDTYSVKGSSPANEIERGRYSVSGKTLTLTSGTGQTTRYDYKLGTSIIHTSRTLVVTAADGIVFTYNYNSGEWFFTLLPILFAGFIIFGIIVFAAVLTVFPEKYYGFKTKNPIFLAMCFIGTAYSFIGGISPDLTVNWGILALVREDGRYMMTQGEMIVKLLILFVPFLAIYAVYAWVKTKSIIQSVLLTVSALIFAMFISLLGRIAVGILICLFIVIYSFFIMPFKFVYIKTEK